MEKTPPQLELINRFLPDLSARQKEQFASLGRLYEIWNARINLVSRADISNLYEKHVLHSLGIAMTFKIPAEYRVIDIGTGGGFPGIPLAIFFPDANFLLVDSIGKKIRAVSEISESIGLTNVTTMQTRVEHIQKQYFDLAVSRAVASLKTLWLWTKPLLHRTQFNAGKGRTPALICLKGGNLDNEIRESRLDPDITPLERFIPLAYFHDKFVLSII